MSLRYINTMQLRFNRNNNLPLLNTMDNSTLLIREMGHGISGISIYVLVLAWQRLAVLSVIFHMAELLHFT